MNHFYKVKIIFFFDYFSLKLKRNLFCSLFNIRNMNTFAVILIIAIIAGGAYFAYWATQKTLGENKKKPHHPPKQKQKHY